MGLSLFFQTSIDGLQMGLVFAVLALGVYISYSILDFPDLSVDGTFPLGGVVCTILMLRLGIPSVLAILLTFFAGFIVGSLTGILHVKFKITNLLSGIIVMTALLSVTFALTKFLGDKGQTTTIFSYIGKKLEGLFGNKFVLSFGKNRDYVIIVILVLFVLAIKIALDLFFRTKLGYMLKATGNNEKLVVSLGKNPGSYKILGLAMANGLVAVSGALYSNLFMQYDNTCGSGKVVLALSSVIIGMAVFSKIRLLKDTTAVILGTLVYSFCLNFLVLVDKNGIYLKLLNAILFALILIFDNKIKSMIGKSKKPSHNANAKIEREKTFKEDEVK